MESNFFRNALQRRLTAYLMYIMIGELADPVIDVLQQLSSHVKLFLSYVPTTVKVMLQASQEVEEAGAAG